MSANTNPIYITAPRTTWTQTDGDGGSAGPLKTQNTALDGTGTCLTVFTAGANGSIISHVTARPAGTNILTVLRFFLNNGSTSATLGNNSLIDEMTLNATTASANTALPLYVWTPPSAGILRLPANYKLMVALGTTVSAGYVITVFGGDF